MKPIVRRYESWGAFVDAAEGTPTSWGPNSSRMYRSVHYGGTSWAGVDTWAEALRLARQGWDEARPAVERLTEAIKDEVRPLLSTTFRSDFDVAGGAVDIGRFLAGEPECMVQVTPVKIAKPGRVISLLVDVGSAASIEPADITKRGAAVCALIEVLELLQHSTELWIEQTVQGVGGCTYSILVRVKGAEDKLDTATVIFALANPAVQRRLVFSIEEQESDEVRGRFQFLTGHYGIPTALTQGKEVEATVKVQKIKYGEYFGDAASRWIREQLVEFALLAPAPVD